MGGTSCPQEADHGGGSWGTCCRSFSLPRRCSCSMGEGTVTTEPDDRCEKHFGKCEMFSKVRCYFYYPLLPGIESDPITGVSIWLLCRDGRGGPPLPGPLDRPGLPRPLFLTNSGLGWAVTLSEKRWQLWDSWRRGSTCTRAVLGARLVRSAALPCQVVGTVRSRPLHWVLEAIQAEAGQLPHGIISL